MEDVFKNQVRSLSSPAAEAVAIVPDDGAELQQVTRAIYVGVGGDVTAQLVSGGQVTFQGLASGGLYPFRVAKVLNTGTTASGLVALW